MLNAQCSMLNAQCSMLNAQTLQDCARALGIGHRALGIGTSETKPIGRLLGPRHAGFVVALPDLCPWATEDVRRQVLDPLARRRRRRPTAYRETLRNALDDRKRVALVRRAQPVEVLHD